MEHCAAGEMWRRLRLAPGWFVCACACASFVWGCTSSGGGSSSSGDESYACHYFESTSTLCTGGYHDYSDDPGCIDVDSEAECDAFTEANTDCPGDCCYDTGFHDVSLKVGSCSTTSGSGGSGGSGGGGGSGTGGGASCKDTGGTCEINSECCKFSETNPQALGNELCVGFHGNDLAHVCAATCNTNADCQSNCCGTWTFTSAEIKLKACADPSVSACD